MPIQECPFFTSIIVYEIAYPILGPGWIFFDDQTPTFREAILRCWISYRFLDGGGIFCAPYLAAHKEQKTGDARKQNEGFDFFHRKRYGRYVSYTVKRLSYEKVTNYTEIALSAIRYN